MKNKDDFNSWIGVVAG